MAKNLLKGARKKIRIAGGFILIQAFLAITILDSSSPFLNGQYQEILLSLVFYIYQTSHLGHIFTAQSVFTYDFEFAKIFELKVNLAVQLHSCVKKIFLAIPVLKAFA